MEGLLPSALAEEPHPIAFMPPVEAQLRQKQRQQLLSEDVIAAAEQSAHSMAGSQSDLHMNFDNVKQTCCNSLSSVT